MPYEILDAQTPEAPSTGSGILRDIARTGSRVGETILGAPGDIMQGVAGLGNLAESGLRGIVDYAGIGPMARAIGGDDVQPYESPLPTSESLKQRMPQYLQPQTPGEEMSDEVFSDLTSLFLGGAKPLRAAAAAGLGQLAKWGAKEAGAGEGGQAGIKLGAMVLSSMVGTTKIKDHMKGLYSKAEAALPESAVIKTAPLEKEFSALWSKMEKGGTSESKKILSRKINQIESKISNRTMPVDEAWQFKRDINESISRAGKLKNFEKYLPSINKTLDAQIKSYGRTNLEFLNNYKNADDLFRASKISEFLEKIINPAAIGAATAGMFFHGGSATKALGAGAGLLGARLGYQGIEMLLKNPAIAKYYGNVVAAAATRNIPQINKELAKLDRVVTKYYGNESASAMPTTGFEVIG